MKHFTLVFALFCALFFFAACGGGTTKISNEQNSDDSTAETDDSDADISSPDSENQNDEEISDSSDSADDSNSDKPDSENPDTTPDNGDSEPDEATDSSDTADDGDTADPDIADTGTEIGETRVQECSELPENAQWNTVSAIVQSWDGEKWVPSSHTEFNMEGSEDECRFKCSTNYGWNGSKCDADTRNVYCNNLPEHARWNDGGRNGTFAQTWNGEVWVPTSHDAIYSKTPTECGFVCVFGYVWDGSQCETAPTQSANCTGLPSGAQWNTASSITQTWDGEKWVPESTAGVYNEAESTTECHFKCKIHYTWSGSACVANTKVSPCMNKPENAEWNTVSSITQTWDSTDWQPSTTGVYNETSSTNECRFVCKTNYKWNALTSKCDPETNVADCTGKPENTVWNGTGKFEQTWNGEVWYPQTYEASYNKTAGTCTYICDTGYAWNETSCAPASTRTALCQTPLPENTEWNTVDTITQTYTGSGWEPSTTPIYNPEPSENECRYKCASGFNWNGVNKCTDFSVFVMGQYQVNLIDIASGTDGAPRQFRIYEPTGAEGNIPVVHFLHGFMYKIAYYDDFLTQLASHGFVVVSSQSDHALLNGDTSIVEAEKVETFLTWLKQNLQSKVSVTVDISHFGVSGHSRGGKVTNRVLNSDPTMATSFFGVDPVDSALPGGSSTSDPASLSDPVQFTGESMFLETEKGTMGTACAPKADNATHFYASYPSPSHHIIAAGVGHADMVDPADVSACGMNCSVCAGSGDTALNQQFITYTGGLMAAFFNATLKGDAKYEALLDDVSQHPFLTTLAEHKYPR